MQDTRVGRSHFDDLMSLQEGIWANGGASSTGHSRPGIASRQASAASDGRGSRFDIPGPVDIIDLGYSGTSEQSQDNAMAEGSLHARQSPNLWSPAKTQHHQSSPPLSTASADSFGDYVLPDDEAFNEASEQPTFASEYGAAGSSRMGHLRRLVSTKGSALVGSLRKASEGHKPAVLAPATPYGTQLEHLDEKQALRRAQIPAQIPAPHLVGRTTREHVLSTDHAAQLVHNLPPRLRLSRHWTLVYSLAQHGAALSTLYRLLDTCAYDAGESGAGFMLAIRDNNEDIFGVYANEVLRPQKGYYGNGECFLWRGARPMAYRWTGLNDYLILTEPGFISFGGGEGKYGLWLDQNLEHGVSSWCPCFDNDVLSGSQTGRFTCVGLEVWAVGL